MTQPSNIRLRFLEQRVEQIKQLPGFKKHHRVPTSANASDEKFIATLAEPLLDSDLQDTFSALRKAYGLKRKEISVDGPFEGTGIIETPFFHYHIEVAIDPEFPSRVIFTRSISDITEPARIVAPAFETVFEKRFSLMEIETSDALDLEAIVDAIEDAESELVKIDYDKDLTWCEIQVINSAATVIVSENSIRVESARETTPQLLLETFAEIQQQFIESLQFDEFAFSG